MSDVRYIVRLLLVVFWLTYLDVLATLDPPLPLTTDDMWVTASPKFFLILNKRGSYRQLNVKDGNRVAT